MLTIISVLKNNKLAFLTAIVIGVICIAPHIVFKISLDSEYQGVYLSKTANELEYLARVKEIIDGHWSLGSVAFFEYKNNLSLMPPNILEFLFAGISYAFGISAHGVLIVSKFFLPVLLFLLIYFFIRQITCKLNAVATGMVVVLGYDLVDYRSLFNYFSGITSPNDFLIWTRPSNPILGALLIFSFLLVIWKIYKSYSLLRDEVNVKKFVLFAGLIFALAITSYFFTWGIILSLISLLFFVGLLDKKYKLIKNLFFVVLIGFLLALPYFYNLFGATKDSSYEASAGRTGFSLTHEPILNKFLIFSLAIFLLLTFIYRKKGVVKKDWWLFSLVLILTGFLALNQQVVTGRTIWPFHFVQYTIPLAITALFIIFYNTVGKKNPAIWKTAIIFSMVASLAFGVYVQASTYKNSFYEYKEKQKYAGVFNWINENAEKDCVVLSKHNDFLSKAVLVYTHCNIYSSCMNTSYLMPFDRLYHNYLLSWRLYGEESEINVASYFYGTEGLQYGASSPSFENIKIKLNSDSEEFLKRDLIKEIKKYKIDYLIIDEEMGNQMKELVNELNLVYTLNNVSVYEF